MSTECSRRPRTPATIPASSGPLRIGGNAVWAEWFNGALDDIRVYNRALTATEINRPGRTRLAMSVAQDQPHRWPPGCELPPGPIGRLGYITRTGLGPKPETVARE